MRTLRQTLEKKLREDNAKQDVINAALAVVAFEDDRSAALDGPLNGSAEWREFRRVVKRLSEFK